MPRELRFDFYIVLALVVLAMPMSLVLQANFLGSMVFFFAIPSLYLLVRQKRQLRRIVSASALFGILFGFAFDFLGQVNNAWIWPTPEQATFSAEILGLVSMDAMIWMFFWVLFVFVFYEHFFEHDREEKLSKNFKYALIPMGLVVLLMILAYLFSPEILNLKYTYLTIGLLSLPAFFVVVYKNSTIIPKLLKASVFFVFLYFTYEITALQLDHWRFPGEFIGLVSIGRFSFPVEEFFFWILFSGVALLAYYELFVDDLR